MTELNLRCVAALSVAAGLVCGCGDTSTTTKADSSVEVAPPEETTVLDEGTPIVTIESTADIVAWGSHVLRVEVLAENERNTSPVGPGEELVGRDVIVQVSDVLWSHSDAVTAVDPGQRLTVYTFPGYLRAGEQTMPAVEEGHLRMDIGGRYVLVMADDTTPEGEQILTLLTTLAPEGGAVRLPGGTALELSEVQRELAGASRVALPGSGPRPGESLVQRLERLTEAP